MHHGKCVTAALVTMLLASCAPTQTRITSGFTGDYSEDPMNYGTVGVYKGDIQGCRDAVVESLDSRGVDLYSLHKDSEGQLIATNKGSRVEITAFCSKEDSGTFSLIIYSNNLHAAVTPHSYLISHQSSALCYYTAKGMPTSKPCPQSYIAEYKPNYQLPNPSDVAAAI